MVVADAPAPEATVLITTKNRRDELRVAVRSAVAQSVNVEVLVIDDGSTDGTSEALAAEFPGLRIIRHDQSRGYVVRRNEGVRAATGRIVFSIDDDAAFSSADVVRQTLREFADDRIGAVAMPYVDVHRGPSVHQRAPHGNGVFVTDRFIGTAHAVRREVFLRLGGYREALVHQGEEGDYCLRMMDQGYVVRLGTADPVHHFESPKRDFRRMDYYGCRNAVLHVWQNVPMPFALWRLPAAVIGCALHTFQPRRLATRLWGLAAGLGLCFSAPRRAVSAPTYRLARSLAAHPAPLQALEPPWRTSRA